MCAYISYQLHEHICEVQITPREFYSGNKGPHTLHTNRQVNYYTFNVP